MTPNDGQIDLLLRRHAGQTRPAQAKGNAATEHLDADELNAFAEGSVPDAARSRYVSHLADCDDCRKVASQLAISGGAIVAAEAKRDPQGYSWWKSLSGFFSPLNLRYAAFALVLIAVVGVTFLVMRQQRQSNFIARNESTGQPQGRAVRSADSTPPAGLVRAEKGNDDSSASTSTAAASPMTSQPESKVAEDSTQPPPPPVAKSGQETVETTAPALAAKKAAEPVTVQRSPSYAPPPPGESARAGNVSSERQEMQRNQPSGPRKSESPFDKSKVMDQSRAGEMAKDNRAQDDSNRAGVNQTQARGNIQTQSNVQRAADEQAQTQKEADNLSTRDRNVRESRPQAPANQSAGAGRRDAAATSEEAPETRSAGGRKFRRQGNSWVDSKFKSSMTLKSISRGSSEFDALDSGLRSIAQQISGQIIVVWKNKAYLIR